MAKKKQAKKSAKSVGGPFVNAAFVCEKVLKEGKVPTFVRVIDTFMLTGPTPKMPPGVIEFVLYVAFKAGDVRGKKPLLIKCESPHGEKLTFESTHMLEFNSGSTGAAVEAVIMLGIKDPGTYWFSVILEGRVITKTPVRVVYEQLPQATEQQTDIAVAKSRQRKPS
jgi:hypothetical protein